MRPCFLLCIALFCCLFARAQEPFMLHYTQQDGLPSNMVYDSYQDDSGFLWFTTDKGIARYNGLKFESFNTAEGLVENECFSFKKDKQGRVWLTTSSGALMYYQHGVFHSALNTPYLKLPYLDGITKKIWVEKDGSITFFFKGSSRVVSVQGNRVGCYNISKVRERYLLKLLVDVRKAAPGTFDLYLEDLIVRVDTLGNELGSWPIPGKLEMASRGQEPLLQILDGNIVDEQFHLQERLPPGFTSLQLINYIYKEQNRYFLCTYDGLWIGNKAILKGHGISAILKDKQGNYWISTLDNGIYKWSGSFDQTARLNALYTGKVSHVLQSGQQILFTTQERNTYRLKEDRAELLLAVAKKDNFIKSLNSGQCMFGSSFLSFSRLFHFIVEHPGSAKPKIKRVLLWRGDKDLPYVDGTKKLYADRSFLYIQSAAEGMYGIRRPQFSGKHNKLVMELLIPKGAYPFSGASVAPDSSIWVSTEGPVYRLEDGQVQAQPQLNGLGIRELIINKHLLIGYTRRNQLLVCAGYQGANIRVDTVNRNCIWDKFFRVNDTAILATTNDYYRLIITRPSSGGPAYEIRVLEDPLIPSHAEYIYSDGRQCYFFRKGDVCKVPVSNLLSPTPAPELYFSRLQTKDSSWPILPEMHLPYRLSRDMTISFTALSYSIPGLAYEYSISGLSDTGKWEQSNGSDISLFKISPGTYRIRLRARTPGSVYYAGPSFVMDIGHPFWQRWWFIGCCILLLGLLAGLGLRYYIRRLTRAKESEIKFLQSEFTALNALMNPHFVFNTLNSVQSLINKDDKKMASEHVRTVADLIRQNMHNISRELITLEQEMMLVINYLKLEQLRFEWLHFSVEVADDVDTDEVMVPPLLVQPLVENAIVHGLWPAEQTHKEVRIRISADDDLVRIEVTDNGVGFSKKQAAMRSGHQSMAMGNTRNRLERLSRLYGRKFLFDIAETRDERAVVTGVRAVIEIGN